MSVADGCRLAACCCHRWSAASATSQFHCLTQPCASADLFGWMIQGKQLQSFLFVVEFVIPICSALRNDQVYHTKWTAFPPLAANKVVSTPSLLGPPVFAMEMLAKPQALTWIAHPFGFRRRVQSFTQTRGTRSPSPRGVASHGRSSDI